MAQDNTEGRAEGECKKRFILNSGEIYDIYRLRAEGRSLSEVVHEITAQKPRSSNAVFGEIERIDALLHEAIRTMSPVPKPDPHGIIPKPTEEQKSYARRLGMDLQQYLMTEYFACIALTGRKMDL